MKKIILLATSCSVLLSGCFFGSQTVNEDAELEMAFPASTKFVAGIDLTSEDQRNQLDEIMLRFPETGLWKELVTQLSAEFEDEGLGEEFWSTVFGGNSKVIAGVDFPDDFDLLADPDAGEDEDDQVSIFVAGEFDNADDVEVLIDVLLDKSYEEQGKDVMRETEGELRYWTVEADDFYLVRYGDIFVLTNTDDLRDQALEQMSKETGLYANDDFTATFKDLPAENLGYLYFDLNGFFSLFEGEEREQMLEAMEVYGNDPEMLSAMGAVGLVISVDEGGFVMNSATELALDPEELEMIIPGHDRELSLIEKVNSDGVMIYMEDQDLATHFEILISSYAVLIDSSIDAYESSLAGLGHGFPDPSLEFSEGEKHDTYLRVMNQIGATTGLSVEELEKLFSNPYAFSVSEKDELYPAIAFYVDLDEETVELGKSFASGLDSFVEETMGQLSLLLPVDAEGQDVLKRERVVVEGGVLYKLYVDWNTFSEETISSLAVVPGFDLREQKVVLYYGVTGNDMLAFALYPDFDEEFGEEVLSDLENYRQGVNALGDKYGYNVTFLQTEPILNFVEKYLDLLNSAGLLTSQDLQDFELYGKQFVGAFKYMIASKSYSDGMIYSDAYLRVQKVD